MTICVTTRLLCNLRSRSPILNQFVKNASVSTNPLQPICRKEVTYPSCNKNQTKHYSRCTRVDPCKKKVLNEEKPESDSFWLSLFSKKKKVKKPPKECCRLLAAQRQCQVEEIPKFIKEMCKDLPAGSSIYRTKGHAFILEVPCKKTVVEKPKTRSEKLLIKMERDKQTPFLEDETNPMPNFTSVGKRLLDLQARKLHPLYRKLEYPQTTRPMPFALETKYRCKADEKDGTPRKLKSKIPFHSKRKEFIQNYKMATLPQYLLNRTRFVKYNSHSSLESRREKIQTCKTKGQHHLFECPEPDCGKMLEENIEKGKDNKPRTK